MTEQIKNPKKVGIKWKMFAILLAFLVVIIAVVWFFQVLMLDVFYRNTKFNELEQTTELIDMADDEREMKSVAYQCAVEYDSSVVVFDVVDGTAHTIIEAGSPTNSIMSFFSKRDLQYLYDMATERGGSYVATVSHDASSRNQKLTLRFEEYSPSLEFFTDFTRHSAVDVKIIHKSGVEYIVIQTSYLAPVAATVKTLNAQFLWIGIILVVLALILALIMSKVITRPIIKMNAAAQKLANGNYDADFEGSGYREIEELSKSLNYASTELAKNDKFQKELISNVSHDLRTPLTMIKGYAEVMRDIPGENTPENVQVVIDETERLAALVNDMLDVSKLQAGTRQPDMQVFSLTQAVSDVLRRYEKLTEQDGYIIDFYADREAFVSADSVMILQVIYNLINNAINYTGEDKTVTVRQDVSQNKVRISVADTGDGIEKEDIPYIWDRYYKVDKVHKRATVGTGLGLSITREILELHNARFGVASKIGYGSNFWFELDLAKDEFYER
ncbi:MAG: HAMP domain-containing histidine kinase [Clostridia bacterium]|nr:HAMP domain-containing histidine kinase [Clostridia bacterium]